MSPYFKNSNKKLIFTHISCIIIILAAFAIPILYMVNNIIIDIDNVDFFDVYNLSKNTVLVSLASSISIVIVVILIQYLKRISNSTSVSDLFK